MPILRRLGEASVGIALGAAAAFAASTPEGPTPTTRPANEEPTREHADDVADYTLRASLDPGQHAVHGEGTIAWRNRSNVAVRELWFHLYLNAFKNERTVFLRAPVG